MIDAITKATLDAERSYSAAAYSAKSGQSSTAPLATVMSDDTASRNRVNMGQATEQVRYFKGWVYAAIRPIMNRIAAQPICIGRKVRRRMPGTKSLQLKASLPLCFKAMGDKIEPLEDHPILSLLSDPNELMTAWQLMAFTVASLELTGQCLWMREGDTLLPVPSSWIRGFEGATRREVFIVQPPGTAEPIPVSSDECVYFHFPHPSDPRAVFSPLQAAAEPVETDAMLQASQRLAFQQGTIPKVLFTAGRLPGTDGAEGQRPILTASQRNQLVTAIKQVSQGIAKQNEPFIIDGLIENVEMLGRSIAEMDFLNSGDAIKARIFQIFGVNPIVAGEIENANRAQATIADENFCSLAVNPIISLMSQVLTEWMGPMFAGPNEELVIWIEEARANDPEQKLKEWSFAGNRGFVTPNEYRRNILNLSDIDGGDELPRPVAAVADNPATPPAEGKTLDPFTLKALNGNGHKHARHKR